MPSGAFIPPPSKPFVVLTNDLRSDVADITRRLGGVALLLNPQVEGQFPVCAVSEIGVIAPPFLHSAGQAWWFVAGEVGTVVYNTTWTKMFANATDQSFMDLGFLSVIEKAQGFELDSVNDTLVHIRSIPTNIVADSSETFIHSNALVWERALPGGTAAAGRFIVSGLNLFEDGSFSKIRAEPQAQFMFRSLIEYAMQLARHSSNIIAEDEDLRSSPLRVLPPSPPLCSRVSSICASGIETEAPCRAVANTVSPIGLCGANFAIAQPTSRFFSDSAASNLSTLDAIHVYVEPNDVRNKDAQLVGQLYRSDGLDGTKTLVANGTAVTPFTNHTFSGLAPVGNPQWVRLPMPAVSLLPAGPTDNNTIFWLGMQGSKDSTCFGVARGSTSPTLGPLAPDSYAGPLSPGQDPASAKWSAGGFSFSAYMSLKE